jgi:CRISPR-associated protein (TIGR02584 family)
MSGPARHHLLCIAGLTPQVVTETLYALYREDPAHLPTDIHVLSTDDGIARARLTLLSDQPGWYHRLCADYRLPPMRFGPDSLHVLHDAQGVPLTDIRDGADNTAAADAVTEWVRRLTADDTAQLHVSLAGGRKTLGFFAGYALSLFGRPQDRLSHVLVNTPYESHPGFFYPTPYSDIIYGQPPDPRPLDSRDALVTLADIPFVRLRHGLPASLLSGRASFSATVQMAQQSLGPPRLEIEVARGRIRAGGINVDLPPVELAFYLWLARRAVAGQPPLQCPPDGAPSPDYAAEFLAAYRSVVGSLGDDDRVTQGLRQGMDKNYFERRKSRVNRKLSEALGGAAPAYLIQGFGRRPRTAYGLNLTSGQILTENLPDRSKG